MKTLTAIFFSLLTLSFLTSATYASENIIAPPGNDLIENAIDLGIGPIPYTEAGVNFPEATLLNDGGGQNCSAGSPGIWYKFTATKIGYVGAGIVSPNAGAALFYEGPYDATMGSDLTWVDQPENPCGLNALVGITTTAGTTYFIYMTNQIVSDVIIDTSEVFEAPGNDLIENATDLNGLEDFLDSDVHFLVATNEGDNGQTGCDTNPVKAVWYKFTATIDGQVVAGIDVAPAGGGVMFYTAPNENVTSGSELTWVDQPTNPCGPNNLSSIDAVAGTTYYLLAAKIGPFATGYADVSINLSGILGVADNTIEGFTYFPNPVSSEINLSAKSVIDEVVIYNILGQNVFTEKSNSTRKVINMSFMQTGLYVMHITSEGKSAAYKIVKK